MSERAGEGAAGQDAAGERAAGERTGGQRAGGQEAAAEGAGGQDAAGEGAAGQDAAGQEGIAEALYGLVTLAVRNGPREISLTAAATLATLERTGPRRLTDLAMIEGVAQPSMTVLVTGLERSGLVERQPGPGDKRVVLVALTPAGRDYLRARRRAGASALADLIGKLPAAEARSLARAVPAMNHLRELDGARRAAGRGAATARSGARSDGASS